MAKQLDETVRDYTDYTGPTGMGKSEITIEKRTEAHVFLYIDGKREFIVESNGGLHISRITDATVEDLQIIPQKSADNSK